MKAELEAAVTKRQMLELMRPLREAELELAVKRARLDLAKIKRMAAGEQQTAKAAMAWWNCVTPFLPRWSTDRAR